MWLPDWGEVIPAESPACLSHEAKNPILRVIETHSTAEGAQQTKDFADYSSSDYQGNPGVRPKPLTGVEGICW